MDEDIEAILKRGEEKTAELEAKYQDMGIDDLAKFTTDGQGTVFQWEGEDYSNKVCIFANTFFYCYYYYYYSHYIYIYFSFGRFILFYFCNMIIIINISCLPDI